MQTKQQIEFDFDTPADNVPLDISTLTGTIDKPKKRDKLDFNSGSEEGYFNWQQANPSFAKIQNKNVKRRIFHIVSHWQSIKRPQKTAL
jgi:hypothetical protein